MNRKRLPAHRVEHLLARHAEIAAAAGCSLGCHRRVEAVRARGCRGHRAPAASCSLWGYSAVTARVVAPRYLVVAQPTGADTVILNTRVETESREPKTESIGQHIHQQAGQTAS